LSKGSTIGEADSYIISARKGDFINAEIIPVIATNQTFEEGILGQLRVFQINRDGTETFVGSNLRSFESLFDTEVFDIVVPKTGKYRIEVTAPDEVFIADSSNLRMRNFRSVSVNRRDMLRSKLGR